MPISTRRRDTRVRRDAVQAESGEQQGERAKEPGQLRDQTFLRQRRVDVIGQRPEGQRELRIHRADGGRDALGSAGAPVRGAR